MRSLFFHERWRALVWLVSLLSLLVLFGLIIFLPPDGSERGGWARFIGQFHPVVVHLPITLVLLVPLLEITGSRYHFSHLRAASDFVLGLATLCAIAAPALGWCLARSGGFEGPLVTQHMWGGVCLAMACWLSWTLRELTRLERSLRTALPYRVALMATVVLVAWTGYRGGQLAHGEDHLVRYLPEPLRVWIGLAGGGTANPTAASDSHTFYGARVQPILDEYCVTCHGLNKQKGGLRLDSHATLMRGGEDGPVVKAGDIERSELFRRLMLPPVHEDFMPPEGRPPSAYEVRVIELWIAAGSSATDAVDAIVGLPTPPPEVVFEVMDRGVVEKARAPLAPVVAKLQARFPFILQYLSRSSADLHLNASFMGSAFGDKELADLAPLFRHIVFADLSRTAISDASAQAVAAMDRLRVLRLTNTEISDVTVRSLVGLKDLESLSVFGTSVSEGALSALDNLPKLRRIHTEAEIPANVTGL